MFNEPVFGAFQQESMKPSVRYSGFDFSHQWFRQPTLEDAKGEVDEIPYGANIRTNRMILLSNNITDNLFSNDERLKSLSASGHRPGRVA